MNYVWVPRGKTGRVHAPLDATPGLEEEPAHHLERVAGGSRPRHHPRRPGGGIFTVTETGVAACVYSLFVSIVVYRRDQLKEFFRYLTALGALDRARHADDRDGHRVVVSHHDRSGLIAAAHWFQSLGLAPAMKFLALNVFLLLVGAVIEGILRCSS